MPTAAAAVAIGRETSARRTCITSSLYNNTRQSETGRNTFHLRRLPVYSILINTRQSFTGNTRIRSVVRITCLSDQKCTFVFNLSVFMYNDIWREQNYIPSLVHTTWASFVISIKKILLASACCFVSVSSMTRSNLF